jgi:tellurite resistance protein TerA
MKTIEKGQKLQIEKEGLSKNFFVNIDWNQTLKPNYEVDASAMIISERGKLEEEENFVFYNNSKSPCSGLILQDSSLFKKTFLVDLNKINNDTSKLMFILTINDGDSLNQRFGDIKDIKVVISDNNKNNLLEFKIDGMTKETAIIAFEVYKRNGEWRIQGVGNGFNSGLSAILKEYGSEKIKIEEETKRPGAYNSKPESISNVSSVITETPKPTISLSKITLEKKGESTKIDLSKKASGASSEIHINLNWNQVAKKSGFFRKAETLDLDLGCMFELQDGYKGVIQALGDSFGSRYNDPYIFLDKDDRSGSSNDGENLYINKPELLKKAVIFCFIYEGTSDFLEAGAYLKVKGLNQEITVNLDSPRPHLTFCIGISIENVNGVVKIQKIDEYVRGHRECDQMFGFNFRWGAGSKD